jgi:ribonucleotide reductase alpha subunit
VFTIVLKTSTDLMSVQFRNMLIEQLATRKTGLVVNEFDSCIFDLGNVVSYEDENGEIIYVVPD